MSGTIGYGNPPVEHQFRKGESGNPGGRPKGIASLTRELFAGEMDETIVRFWAGVMSGGNLPGGRKPTVRESLEASKLLAAYGWGKPAEYAPIDDADPLDFPLRLEQDASMAEAIVRRADEINARRRRREEEQMRELPKGD